MTTRQTEVSSSPRKTQTTPFGNDEYDVGREHPRALVPLPGEGNLRPPLPARLDGDRKLRRRLRQLPVSVKPLCKSITPAHRYTDVVQGSLIFCNIEGSCVRRIGWI